MTDEVHTSYPKAKITLANVKIDRLTLDATPMMPKQYLNWVIEAKAMPGKLTIGELEIPLEFVSINAEIKQEYINEDVLKDIFPELYQSSPTTARNEK